MPGWAGNIMGGQGRIGCGSCCRWMPAWGMILGFGSTAAVVLFAFLVAAFLVGGLLESAFFLLPGLLLVEGKLLIVVVLLAGAG
jgi:hypothetical protein